jgi:arginase
MVEAGLVTQLSELGWKVNFNGQHKFEEISAASDPPIGKVKNPRLVSSVTEAVSIVIGDHVKKGELPVTLGGDHSLVRGCWRALI